MFCTSKRIITPRYNSAFAKLTTVVCYAPKEDAEEDEKVSFHDNLQKVVDETPSHDVLLIMGDLNAKVGRNNQDKEGTMGQQGLGNCNNNGERLSTLGQQEQGNCNNNGERLSTFCMENNLVIGGTIFMYKDIHKTTWNSPDGHTKNQIDHVITNKRWRGGLLDVVARHGADVGSDHSYSLVLAKVKLKLRKTRRKDQRPPPIDSQKLKDLKIKKTFQIKVYNKFSLLMEDSDEIDMVTFNKVLPENGQQLLGPKRRERKNGPRMLHGKK